MQTIRKPGCRTAGLAAFVALAFLCCAFGRAADAAKIIEEKFLDDKAKKQAETIVKAVDDVWASKAESGDKIALLEASYEKLDEVLIAALRNPDNKKKEHMITASYLVEVSKRSNSPEVTAALLGFVKFGRLPRAEISRGPDTRDTPEHGYPVALSLIQDRSPVQVQREIARYVEEGGLRGKEEEQDAVLLARVFLLSFLPVQAEKGTAYPAREESIARLQYYMRFEDPETPKGKAAVQEFQRFIEVVKSVPYPEQDRGRLSGDDAPATEQKPAPEEKAAKSEPPKQQ